MRNFPRKILGRSRKQMTRKRSYIVPQTYECKFLVVYINSSCELIYRLYKYEPYTLNNRWEIVAMFMKHRKRWIEYQSSYFLFRN